MKTIGLVLLWLVAFGAQAAPFIVSDPDPTGAANKCVYQDGAGPAVETLVVANACKIDLAEFGVGAHNLQVWFRSDLWGVTSVKVPFELSRPSASGTGPQSLRLEP